jgi:chromosome partitioning protein
MPVITFANSKGGSGKTTSTLILASELSESAEVIVIDADKRRPLVEWFEKGRAPKNVRVLNALGEDGIHDQIAAASAAAPFVLIDLEGTGSQFATFAMGESDLVIIPSQEQYQDAQASVETLAALRRMSRTARRDIPAAILFTRTKPVGKSKTNFNMRKELGDLGIPVFPTEVNERGVFSAMYETGLGIRDLDPKDFSKDGHQKAVQNAYAYAEEVILVLRALKAGKPLVEVQKQLEQTKHLVKETV